MSDISGIRDTSRRGHPVSEYGEELQIAGGLGIRPRGGQYGRELLTVGMGATVAGHMLYVTGRGRLYVADISDPAVPCVMGKMSGLGNSRQIVVSEGLAYVTSREDGLFIADVTQPRKPKLLCHYDSIELATGVAVSGDILFIACRHYGVELVDVSNPERPMHISTVHTGEAQSVIARDGYLYTGVWGVRELVIADVSNPRSPHVVAKAPLDGHGDGVDVRGDYCFVATGHHSPEIQDRGQYSTTTYEELSRQGALPPGYGCGHGLEIFDVSDPEHPHFVSRVKMPPYYRLGMDFWSVTASGDYAFVSDTHNGIFVVDISDIENPSFVAHRQLDYLERRGFNDPVGDLAVAADHIYVAGVYSDVHIVAAPGLASPPDPEPDQAPAIPPYAPQPHPGFRIYRPDGQVYGVAFHNDTAIVAAGMAGLHVVELWPRLRKIDEYATEGFAMDVKVLGDYVYVAEGRGGLSIWGYCQDGQLVLLGRYRARRATIRQVVVPPPGKYALLQVGANYLHIVDLSDASHPVCVLNDTQLGLMVEDQIADGLLDGRYACVFWSHSGLLWYDIYGGLTPEFTGERHPCRLGSRNGVSILEGAALVSYSGSYFLLRKGETLPPEELPQYGVEGYDLNGKPSISGGTMFISDRRSGRVTALDVSDLEKPMLRDILELEGNPARVVVHNGVPIIPAGYQGLLVWDVKSP
jgi:hypothetical protein